MYVSVLEKLLLSFVSLQLPPPHYKEKYTVRRPYFSTPDYVLPHINCIHLKTIVHLLLKASSVFKMSSQQVFKSLTAYIRNRGTLFMHKITVSHFYYK